MKFSGAQVSAALDIARRLGTESVSDKDLLGQANPHTNIGDFRRITRYLTPSAIRYLAGYARDAYRVEQHRISISGLVLVAFESNASRSGQTNRKALKEIPLFDKPFEPQTVSVHVDPLVGLDASGRMTLHGTATATIPATRNHVHYIDKLSEKFTYSVAAISSAAGPLGVDGWYGYANATFKRR